MKYVTSFTKWHQNLKIKWLCYVTEWHRFSLMFFMKMYVFWKYIQGRNQRWQGGKRPPNPFLKIEKYCPDFGLKNVLLVAIYGLKLSFKMLFFSCGAFLLYGADETFIEVPLFQEASHTLKNAWLHPRYSSKFDMIS